MANVEGAIRMKRVGGLVCQCGLALTALGSMAIFLGTLSAGIGSSSFWSPGHLAVLVGVAIVLCLGVLPALVGGILWLSGTIGLRTSHKPE